MKNALTPAEQTNQAHWDEVAPVHVEAYEEVALLKAGLRLESFNEYDRLFFKLFPGMEPCIERWYHYAQYAGKLPWIFTLAARKERKAGFSVTE